MDGILVIRGGEGPSCQPPSIASEYTTVASRDNCGAPPGARSVFPRTDTHHVMGPMHVAYAVCSVYMPVIRGGIDVEASSTRAQAQIEA